MTKLVTSAKEQWQFVADAAGGELELCIWASGVEANFVINSTDRSGTELFQHPQLLTGIYRVHPNDLNTLLTSKNAIRVTRLLNKRVEPRVADAEAVQDYDENWELRKPLMVSLEALRVRDEAWGTRTREPSDIVSGRRDVVMGTLIALLFDKRAKAKWGGKPNISALTEMVLEKLDQHRSNASKPGFGSRTISGHLSKAQKAYEDMSKD